MSELLEYIKGMLDQAIECEDSLMIIYSRLNKAYEGLENEKSEDISGLKIPNFFTFIQAEKNNKEELDTIKFHLETKIKENKERRKKG